MEAPQILHFFDTIAIPYAIFDKCYLLSYHLTIWVLI